jgi:DNA end-binding protein Ku
MDQRIMKTKKSRKRSTSKKDTNDTPERPAIRPFWSGTITFGLVSVPVDLYPAARRGGMPLRMLDQDGTPLSRRYYCPQHEREVPPEHIIRGYEIAEDEYIVVQDSELEVLAPRKSRDIDLTRFVPQGEIPPLFFERAYFLIPSGESTKAYRLLAGVMEKSQRAGVATFVMRDKEYLVAIISEQGVLRAETLRFEDELRNPDVMGLPKPSRVKNRAVTALAKLVQRHAREELPLEALEDHPTQRLRQLVETKRRKGQDVFEAPDVPADEELPEEDGEVSADGKLDLLETIRRSLHAPSETKSANGTASKSKLTHLTKEELLTRAQRRKISGRSKMNKQQLIQALSQSG